MKVLAEVVYGELIEPFMEEEWGENMIEDMGGIGPPAAGESPHQTALGLSAVSHESGLGKELAKVHKRLAMIQMGVAYEPVFQGEIELLQGSSHISPGLAITPFVVGRHLHDGRLTFVIKQPDSVLVGSVGTQLEDSRSF